MLAACHLVTLNNRVERRVRPEHVLVRFLGIPACSHSAVRAVLSCDHTRCA